MNPELATRVSRHLTQRFGAGAPPRVALAPGRVNLIGEHTDYNAGFVLPLAIDRGVAIAFRPRADRSVRVHTITLNQTRSFPLDRLAPRRVRGWPAYVAGVAWAMQDAGYRLPGLDCVIESDLPTGAGLSSSAALEVATARALCDAASIEWDGLAMAQLCRRAENEFVGVPCGLMDQLAAAVSQPGCALLIDCRSLQAVPVPMARDAVVVVMDTGTRRDLTSSAYGDRRAACEAAVATLRSVAPGLEALRDADLELLERARDGLDPVVYRRARHVIEENARPPALAAAFRAGDLPAAGRLMNQSHASLRDLYQVSSAELDRATDLAREHPACFGARMTGAGFGGCALALVRRERAADFVASVEAAFHRETGLAGAFFVSLPEAGARLAPVNLLRT